MHCACVSAATCCCVAIHCRLYFQIKPELPRSQWRATKMTVKISSTADLWRTCYKSPYATIEIPELEFEFSADGKRHTDSIYNHIGSAVYNLGACGGGLIGGCLAQAVLSVWLHVLARMAPLSFAAAPPDKVGSCSNMCWRDR